MKQQISYQMDDGLNVTGEIPVSYDNTIFADIEENIVLKKSNINVHYDMVMSTLGENYKGMSKYAYGNILQAIKTIVDCKTHHSKSPARAHAVAYLHREILFSPATIQKILLLFGVKMPTSKILNDSSRVFETMHTEWMYNVYGGLF
ncbi:Hypothetical protein Nlim_1818 [Candidatus Nitrosarchaeum limnium SFB1]|jgi:hypothetical protein|uniref:Uncharacterized protein n=1 Tax=Candidatus Nitrosarchaeum limnium SFB1 TaxID=886738 RepID=F3KMR7_9ARCH|nr:Hypothetical protein Nlim_1818 [Candidatus Nitrosarchaeum limnium SFB1]